MSGFWGTRVVVTPYLPVEPTFAEQIRRRVRHGLADVLAWLGEEVGPEPTSPIGAITTPDAIYVSQEVYDLMKRTETLCAPAGGGSE